MDMTTKLILAKDVDTIISESKRFISAMILIEQIDDRVVDADSPLNH
jgi:hypothetical protein